MRPSFHFGLSLLLRLAVGLASATMTKSNRRDPKGRFLAASPSTEPSEPASIAASFIFPSISDLSTSPVPTSPNTLPVAPPPTPQTSAPTTPNPTNGDDDNFMPETTAPF